MIRKTVENRSESLRKPNNSKSSALILSDSKLKEFYPSTDKPTLKYNLQKLMQEEKVNHPSHYTWLKDICGIEVIDITRNMNFNLGNCIKYILRHGHKSEQGYSDKDKAIEDLKKARWYLDDEINRLINK